MGTDRYEPGTVQAQTRGGFADTLAAGGGWNLHPHPRVGSTDLALLEADFLRAFPEGFTAELR